MTVLSQTRRKQACAGFSPKGRYSYLQLLFQFGCDWHVDLPVIRGRIAALNSGDDLAVLLRDILSHDRRASAWAKHANARAILRAAYQNCADSWEVYLQFEPDRDQQTLEYLADLLTRFKAATA